MTQPKFKFELNEEVTDVVTGLTGIIMCRTEYSTGCHHYGIQPRLVTKEGKVPSWEYLDESRLTATGQSLATLKPPDAEDPSGPFQNPPQL
ncbi:hypothetical protein ES708_32458 [subsurface metagenome]